MAFTGRGACGLAGYPVWVYAYFRFLFWSYRLGTSTESIVSAYVRLKNRMALENMRELRRQLLEQLQSTSGISLTDSRDALHEDLRVIEDGLEQLQPRQ